MNQFTKKFYFLLLPVIVVVGQPQQSPSSSSSAIPPTNPNTNRNYDRFNYVETTQDDIHYDFGPKDWEYVQCPELETCVRCIFHRVLHAWAFFFFVTFSFFCLGSVVTSLPPPATLSLTLTLSHTHTHLLLLLLPLQEGWADKYEYSKGWDLYQGGNCLWCPADDSTVTCDSHHESPINLLRARAIDTDAEYNECIDVHWMQYHDSSCTFDQLKEKNGFRIERHSLKIVQPIVLNATGSYVLDCQAKGKSWGRIDFSRGFTAWWYLSHLDVKVPSEHVQEGKRYDAEIQLSHFYSKSGEEAGVDNEVRFYFRILI
jgi:hypothetical protein